MGKKILMNVAEGDECRIAVVEGGKLFEYFVDRPSQLKHLGNIYKGVVSNVEPGIQAAFIDLGMDRNGFLHVSDTLMAYSRVANVADMYKPVTRTQGASEMPPYTEQIPPQTVQEEEQGFVETPQSTEMQGERPALSTRSETQMIEDEQAQSEDSEAERHNEPEFLDKLTQVTPGHNVTHSPTEVIADKSDSARMPAIGSQAQAEEAESSEGTAEQAPPPARKAERPRGREVSDWNAGWHDRDVEAGRQGSSQPASEPRKPEPPAKQEPEKSAEPDVVPGVVSEHEQQNFTPSKSQRRKRPPLEIFKPVEAPEFKLPPPPKKKKSGMFRAVPPPEQGPDATGTRDIDGNPTGGDGSSPQRAFMRGPLPKIQNLLKRDQEVLVQVTKASQGGKGPGLSTYLSLPGRYMVLMPNSNKGGVSRKIEDDQARDALRRMLDTLPVPQGMGVVIRTAAIGRTYDELNRDLNYLLRLWNVIVQRMHEAAAPALIYADTDPAIRAVRDYFTADTDEIVIDDKAAYERVIAFFDMIMPSFKSRVRLYEGDVPLFYAEGIETQIDHIFDKKIPLRSGGYLYIEQTEALVAIDVNSGRFTSAGDAEQTAYRTNLEAIPEIVRQLRLRDLGGIICNDFIDMLSPSHRAEVEMALKRELRTDRARTKIARMSPFGVIEMTRQRVRPSIRAYTYVPCPTCTGSGHVRSAETLCLTLIRQMKLALSEERVKSLMVQVHPHVLSHLHSEFREDIDQLEERYDKRIVFEFARDLVLGDTRIFYVNDRDARVLYDLDQKINQYVKEIDYQSKINVPLPPASLGVAGQPEPEVKFSDRRGRRGGKRQRDRDLERQHRMMRSQAESAKAVPSFGAAMPDLPAAPAPAPVQPRAEAPTPQEGVVPAAPQNGNGQRPHQGQPNQGGQFGEGRRRRGRRGGRRRREREERRKQMMAQGQQPGQPAQQQPAPNQQSEQPAPAVHGEPQQTQGGQRQRYDRGRRGRHDRHRDHPAKPADQSAPAAPVAAPTPTPAPEPAPQSVPETAPPSQPQEAEVPKKRATARRKKPAEGEVPAEAAPKKRTRKKAGEEAPASEETKPAKTRKAAAKPAKRAPRKKK